MRDTLRQFTTTDLFKASLCLLDKLGLKYTKGAEGSLSAKDLFRNKQLPKSAVEALELVTSTYFVAIIDERTFEANREHVSLEAAIHDAEDEKYNGMFVFAIEISHDTKATRSMMSTITRAFNLLAVEKPAVLLIRQNHKLSLSICERTKFKQKGKSGKSSEG